ncbi:hypothetical protein GE061_010466, partial [Apolygus lucorum]
SPIRRRIQRIRVCLLLKIPNPAERACNDLNGKEIVEGKVLYGRASSEESREAART